MFGDTTLDETRLWIFEIHHGYFKYITNVVTNSTINL